MKALTLTVPEAIPERRLTAASLSVVTSYSSDMMPTPLSELTSPERLYPAA